MKNITQYDIGKTTARVIKFAVDAAEDHVNYCVFSGDEPDTDMSMGLWQSFQVEFPKATFAGDYDAAIWVFTATYENTVRALVRAHTPA